MKAVTYSATQTRDLLRQELTRRGCIVYPADTSSRPDLLAEHPALGLIAIDLIDPAPAHHPAATVTVTDAVTGLNRKITALRADIPPLRTVKVARRVIVPPGVTDTSPHCLAGDQAIRGDWVDDLPPHPLPEIDRTALHRILCPPLVVNLPRRGPMTDVAAPQRAAHRITLDQAQSAIARRPVHDVMLITGPPGSGKTLVLAARARTLAALHPEWRIQLLCYNRLLVPYLQSILHDLPQVTVGTFGKFAHGRGFSVSLRDETSAAADVRRQLPAVTPDLDALLIDEWQDFMPAWTDLAMAMVKPGHGGIALAGDPAQALYRDTAMEAELSSRHVETVTLTVPYRSTRPILDVTSALDPSLHISGAEGAPTGEPVDLVWAHSMAEQAAAVARDIRLLLDDEHRRPADIAVLVTRKWDIGRIVRNLVESKIPVRAIYANQAETLSLEESTVKIMTVHSAKGYEFPVVFLVGLEHLAQPDGSQRSQREGRSGYVGLTRARDQLVMTYTRDNTYLERIRTLPSETLRPWVWPDDYPEV